MLLELRCPTTFYRVCSEKENCISESVINYRLIIAQMLRAFLQQFNCAVLTQTFGIADQQKPIPPAPIKEPPSLCQYIKRGKRSLRTLFRDKITLPNF